MKTIGKSILIALGVVLAEWIFLPLFLLWFDGMSNEANLIIGVGFFLAFEIAFCTRVYLKTQK